MASHEIGDAELGAEANIEDGIPLSINERLIPNYWVLNIPSMKRSHEEPVKLYYLVFKPFDKGYDPDFIAYDHIIRKLGALEDYIITREINATKVHYNVMAWSTRDLTKLNDGQTNKYKISSQLVKTYLDKYTVYDYCFKESKERYFHHYLDYVYRVIR